MGTTRAALPDRRREDQKTLRRRDRRIPSPLFRHLLIRNRGILSSAHNPPQPSWTIYTPPLLYDNRLTQ